MTEQSSGLLVELLSAAQTAVLGHDGQKRKGSGQPYVLHPLRVAQRIVAGDITAEADLRVAALAAVLHDVLEDTEVPRGQLLERFGPAVVKVVEELTQDKSLPKAERRRKMVEGCGRYSLEARIVKLADRWDNMTEMEAMPEDFIARYCGEARQMIANMKGSWPTAEAAIATLIEHHQPGDRGDA